MNEIGLIIAISTAIAAWVAIYFQRRAVIISEDEIKKRVGSLEQITREIENEREERKFQIGERIEADKLLSRDVILRELDVAHSSNDILILGDILVFQQIVAVYLRRSQDFDKEDSELARHFSDHCTSIISFIGRRNKKRILTKQIKSYDDLEEKLKELTDLSMNEIEALEAAYVAGRALLSRLETLGAISMSDGSKLSGCFTEFSKAMHDISEPYNKLINLGKTQKI